MNDHMMFPHDWVVFLEDYSFGDNEEVYTNGARLIPTFRVEQMMGHYLPKAAEESKPRWIPVTERLPEKDTLVLCVGRKGGMFLGKPSPYFSTAGGSIYCSVPNARSGREATHWMPLPDAPAGDS